LALGGLAGLTVLTTGLGQEKTIQQADSLSGNSNGSRQVKESELVTA
jgi:hypothetical protein